MFWQRRFLFSAEAATRQAEHSFAMRDGKSYLRNANCTRRLAGRLSRPGRFRRCQFAHRVELENWAGAHAIRWGRHFFYRDDDLRIAAVFGGTGVQGNAQTLEVNVE